MTATQKTIEAAGDGNTSGARRAVKHPLSSDFGLPYYATLIERCRHLIRDGNKELSVVQEVVRQVEAWDRLTGGRMSSGPELRQGPIRGSDFLPTRTDLNALELAMCELLPLQELTLRLIRLQQEFKDFGGDEAFVAYEKCFGSGSTPTRSEDSYRAEATFLTMEVQRFRLGLMALEDRRRRALWRVLGALGVLVIAVWIGAACMDDVGLKDSSARASLIVKVGAAGAMGSIFSYLYRAQQASMVSAQDGRKITLITVVKKRLDVEWVVSISIGVIAATTLCALMASNLVSGELFAWKPGTAAPNGWKLWFWSFVAGFAERLVPDLLDSFVSRAKSASQQGAGNK